MMAASFLSLVTGLSVDKTVAFTGSLDLRYGRAQTLWDSLRIVPVLTLQLVIVVIFMFIVIVIVIIIIFFIIITRNTSVYMW
jgi:hypothetical protein